MATIICNECKLVWNGSMGCVHDNGKDYCISCYHKMNNIEPLTRKPITKRDLKAVEITEKRLNEWNERENK